MLQVWLLALRRVAHCQAFLLRQPRCRILQSSRAAGSYRWGARNRASAWLALELWPEALADAEEARRLASAALRTSRGASAGPSLVRALGRKGLALSGGA